MKKFLIAGLGNPGARYAKTRHNAGIDFIEELSKKWNLEFEEIKSVKSKVSIHKLDDVEVYLLVPDVFMNNSGKALKPALKKYNLNINDVLIVHDDLDLPSGTCKLKKYGGDGGHNGLKSIIENFVFFKPWEYFFWSKSDEMFNNLEILNLYSCHFFSFTYCGLIINE